MRRPGHELILGGARSGKSRTAEQRAAAWLAAGPQHTTMLVATALAGDDEMQARIARHREDRRQRLPALASVEAPSGLGAAVKRLAQPQRMLVVDCLTLWLTQCLLPPESERADLSAWGEERDELIDALRTSESPIVLVSNEIGLGVMPMTREARLCVDELGLLHQQVARHCTRVTLLVAGCEMVVKDDRAMKIAPEATDRQ